MTSKINLLGFSLNNMEAFVLQLGEPRYRALQLVQWIHQQGIKDFSLMTNISKSLRIKLEESAVIEPPSVISEQLSSDGTCKWLFHINAANAVEAVFIPEEGRGTLCISSQAGCALNCSFCATGKEGFNRNLTAAEIIGQVWMVVRRLAPQGLAKNHAITNVVMMGMGEPLLNFDAVLEAMDLMMCDHAYGLSKYRVTLSTAGVIPAMLQLQQKSLVSLAVSLHAPNNELRNQLVPLNKKYPLEQLIPVCRNYFPANSKRVVTFEYVMLAGINDQLEHAAQLARLLRGVPCKMNLIPFNTFKNTQYQCSDSITIAAFQQYLIDNEIKTWVRKRRGDDIAAACGQLAGQINDRTGRHKRWERTGVLVPVKAQGVPIESGALL